MSTDFTKAPTQVLTTGDEHERLAKLAGTWSGVARTWLDPSKPAELNAISATGVRVLGGRFLRLQYRSSLARAPIAGELLLAFERDERRWAAAWIDSFHTGTAILFSHGVPREQRGISVFGQYFVKGVPQRWGWRTVVDDSQGLLIRMYNVSPDRVETLGVEIELAKGRGRGAAVHPPRSSPPPPRARAPRKPAARKPRKK